MTPDFSHLSMTEIIRLQNALSQQLSQRFEKPLALVFSDIVGSTSYFARFGDQAGRMLQQLHVDLLEAVLRESDGRIVDTAGDGVFFCFPSVDPAVHALIAFQESMSRENAALSRDHQLTVRIGMHWGCVLTDGVQVTGDAVNLCARVASSADGGEIRLTKEAAHELSNIEHRLSCRPLPPIALKDIASPVPLLVFEWRDRNRFPDTARIDETGVVVQLPPKDAISFGRLKDADGWLANDVVLEAPDPADTKRISRWHFELRRKVDGFVLRQVSDQLTEVDGQAVAKGEEVPIRPGSTVRLSRLLTLRFSSSPFAGRGSDEATMRLG